MAKSKFIPASVFLKQLKTLKNRLPDGPAVGKLNEALADESTPFSLLLGCILENYHYVKSAPQHIGVALTHCSDPKLKKILVDFFVDEHNHEELILETLVKMGLKEKDVDSSRPTVGTLALISLQSDMGRQSSLAYLACRSLNEATRESVRNRREVLNHFVKRYGLRKDAFAAYMTHAEEDLEAGHVSLVKTALKGSPGIRPEEASAVYQWMSDINWTYDLRAHAILNYYGRPGCRVPYRGTVSDAACIDGSTGAKVFKKRKEPSRHEPGSNLNFLLQESTNDLLRNED